MKIKKIISLFLALALIISIAGCAGKSAGNQTLPTFSEEGEIMRSAWWCPYPTAESYKIYKECNLNTIMHANHNFINNTEGYWDLPSEKRIEILLDDSYYIGTPKDYTGENITQKSLKLAKENDLSVILYGGNNYFNWNGLDTNVYKDHDIDYSEYEDVITGVFGGDEPKGSEIEHSASIVPDAQKFFPDVPIFCNLFPSYASLYTLETDSYYDYLDLYGKTFLEKCKGPRLLSVDFYPFIGRNGDMWMYDYLLVADVAKKYNADTHFFIQSVISEDGSHREINEAEMRLQVNVALAYGASAYSYFLYEPAGDAYPIGLIDKEGTPSDMYYHAQAANNQTMAIEKAFLHYDHVLTTGIVSDESEYVIGSMCYFQTGLAKTFESDILTSYASSNRALLGLFRDKDGNEAYYIVNFFDPNDTEEETADCTITLNFNKMKYASIYGTTECLQNETKKLESGTLEYTLKPGEGMFVIPYKK